MSLDEYIKSKLGLKPDVLTDVEVTLMPKEVREVALNETKIKRCYDNCFNLANRFEATYVLGVFNMGLPVPHAWLKIDGQYVDPTVEIHTQQTGTYHSLVEVPADELIDYISEIDDLTGKGCYPPMFSTVCHHPKHQDLFFKWYRELPWLTELLG